MAGVCRTDLPDRSQVFYGIGDTAASGRLIWDAVQRESRIGRALWIAIVVVLGAYVVGLVPGLLVTSRGLPRAISLPW